MNERGDPDQTEPAASAPAPTIDDQARRMFAQQQDIEAEIFRLQDELVSVGAAYGATPTTTLTLETLDERVAALTELDERRDALQKHMRTAMHRYILLDDLIYPLRVRGRANAEQRKRQEIVAVETTIGEMRGQIDALSAQIEGLQAERYRLEDTITPLAQAAARFELRIARIQVNVRTATSWRPPDAVLVKASSWRAFVERAQAAGLEHAMITIDEFSGVITQSPLDT